MGAHLARIPLAALEHARVVVAGHVPHAAHDVVDVLAVLGRAGPVLARADAELVRGHEVRPLVRLLEVAAERTRED